MPVPNIALLWADIETTGLNYETDLILEVAWQITDYLGEPLTETRSYLTVDQDDEALLGRVLERYQKASSYVKDMHRENGLWNEVLFGTDTTRRGEFFTVMDHMITDLDEVRGDAEVRFAGSSVGFDKRFIETVFGGELPISHRVHDLSTFRPFFDWQGMPLDEFSADLPGGSHRAAADIERDIAQRRGVINVFKDAL